MNKESNAKPALHGGTVFQRHANALLLLLEILFATLLFSAPAVAMAGSKALKANPALANLEIEFWPEYDRPAMLVIMKGEIAPHVALPAAVAVRIPAASGGPSAVAISADGSGNLKNATYEREDAGKHVIVKLAVRQRNFHIEFYDPIVTSSLERNYTYVWPGDLATNRLAVTVQEPAGTLDLMATPALRMTSSGRDGLNYRSAQLGAFEAGKQLAIKIAYSKSNSRTSTEILRPQPDGSLTATPPSPDKPVLISGKIASGWVLGALGLVLAIVAAATFFLWRRRTTATPGKGGRFCSGCGGEAGLADRFCSKCGEKIK